MRISHRQQQAAWEKEHRQPQILPHLAGDRVSGGVERFWRSLPVARRKQMGGLSGLEFGCGKGRNAIWLARQGATIEAFDFSSAATAVARSRVPKRIAHRVHIFRHDATRRWPFPRARFDFVIDCFASTDIESAPGRRFVVREIHRVLKPGGYFFLYTNSPNSEWYRDMVKSSRALSEPRTFSYPGMKKFEKVFSAAELKTLYRGFLLRKTMLRVRSSPVMGRSYRWEHAWSVYQKKSR